MNPVCIIQARLSSTRLPAKVLMLINRKPMLWHVVTRCQTAKKVNKVVVATSTSGPDDLIERYCTENGFEVFRGPEEDVLARYYMCARKYNADPIIRVTADCPLIQPHLIDHLVECWTPGTYAFVDIKSWYDGTDCECFGFPELFAAHNNATSKEDREHVTKWIRENIVSRYGVGTPKLSVDTPYELERVTRIMEYEDGLYLRGLQDVS